MSIRQFFKDSRKKFINVALNLLEWAIKITPRWLIKLFLGAMFNVASLFIKRLRSISATNLRLVYGDSKNEQEYQKIVTTYIKTIGYSMLDLLYYVGRPKELSKIVHFEHEKHLKDALGLGRGVIGVTAHLGNFPLMFVSLSQRGYKVNVVIRTMRDAEFSKFMHYQCAKWKINMIQTSPKKQFLKETLGALKRNELLFILLDENVPQEGNIKVRFFNRDVNRAPGPILFLERTGAPIVPMFIALDEKDEFRIFIEKPFEIHIEHTKDENLVRNITGLTNIIEQYVRRYPLQWGGWLNKRWAYGN